MSFTIYLILFYAVLILADLSAFFHAKRTEKWILFIGITGIIIASAAVLGYLWITFLM